MAVIRLCDDDGGSDDQVAPGVQNEDVLLMQDVVFGQKVIGPL
jgi:hypothetical protein